MLVFIDSKEMQSDTDLLEYPEILLFDRKGKEWKCSHNMLRISGDFSGSIPHAPSLSLTHLPHYSSLLITDQQCTFTQPKPRIIRFRLTPYRPPTIRYNSSTNNCPLKHNYHWFYL
ncbi:hypothetical protein H5410_056688 [Solanum commersonii]|uniref:Uncharacterized protein n=1 Tax=Solanum commersonii TaxID=4109 RepID=A0A9J5WM17_SOLCO|nr:hypothetical protein H5410_056688 [Solanum commersonii]